MDHLLNSETEAIPVTREQVIIHPVVWVGWSVTMELAVEELKRMNALPGEKPPDELYLMEDGSLQLQISVIITTPTESKPWYCTMRVPPQYWRFSKLA